MRKFNIGTQVIIYDEDWFGEHGTIVGTNYDNEDDLYEVELEESREIVIISDDCLEIRHGKAASV